MRSDAQCESFRVTPATSQRKMQRGALKNHTCRADQLKTDGIGRASHIAGHIPSVLGHKSRWLSNIQAWPIFWAIVVWIKSA